MKTKQNNTDVIGMFALFFIILLILSSFSACTTATPKKPDTEEPKVAGPVCPGPKAVGWASKEEMTDMDWTNFKTAIGRCRELYPNSPCLKVFIKKAENTYNAICGEVKHDSGETEPKTGS